MTSEQQTPVMLQAAQEAKGHRHQSVGLLFPAQTMGFFALVDSAGSWAEEADLACVLALQTLLDHLAPLLSHPSLLRDDACLTWLQAGAQHVHQALCADRDYGPCSLTAIFLVGTEASIVHAGTNCLSIAHFLPLHQTALPLYQVTRDASAVRPDGTSWLIWRMLGGQGVQGKAQLDAMKLALFPGDTLLLGTGSLWHRLPEAARDAALHRWFDDPVQLCHQLFASADQESRFLHLLVVRVKEAESGAPAHLPRLHVIHIPEQIVLPKALQELQP